MKREKEDEPFFPRGSGGRTSAARLFQTGTLEACFFGASVGLGDLNAGVHDRLDAGLEARDQEPK